jgi:hypothetical protein
LRKVDGLWSIALNSLFNHLNDKTWTRKNGVMWHKTNVKLFFCECGWMKRGNLSWWWMSRENQL